MIRDLKSKNNIAATKKMVKGKGTVGNAHCTCMKLSLVCVVCNTTTHQVNCNVSYVVYNWSYILVLTLNRKAKDFFWWPTDKLLVSLSTTGFP